MLLEANASLEGALAAGATAVLVNDSHWLMRNLLVEELHEAAELISGGPERFSMPVTFEVTFTQTQMAEMAEMAELVPGSVRIDGRTVSYTLPDYREAFRAWRAFYNLASVD